MTTNPIIHVIHRDHEDIGFGARGQILFDRILGNPFFSIPTALDFPGLRRAFLVFLGSVIKRPIGIGAMRFSLAPRGHVLIAPRSLE